MRDEGIRVLKVFTVEKISSRGCRCSTDDLLKRQLYWGGYETQDKDNESDQTDYFSLGIQRGTIISWGRMFQTDYGSKHDPYKPSGPEKQAHGEQT